LNGDDVTAVTSVTEVQAGKGPPRGTMLLGKYRVESILGFGGMGLVLRAHNVALDEPVAIKLLREDIQLAPDNITRFLREAQNAVRLKSEHVARVRDVGTFDDDRPYMVMELLEGLDLGKLLVEEGKIERIRAVDLILQACDAIAEAHSLGIVHRDIKPTNLFITKRRDGSDLLKVLDFGIAKANAGAEMSLTQTSSMLGTPAYMSPEQMRSARNVDPRSDIWSLGCVLYELVEGRQPFDADNFAELCVMVAIEEPAPLVLAPELASVIARCLAKDVDARYQSVAELAGDLMPYASNPASAQRQVERIERLLTNPPLLPRAPTPTHTAVYYESTAPIPKQRSRLALVLVTAAAFVAIGIGAGLYAARNEEPPVANIAPADAAIAAEPVIAPIASNDAGVVHVIDAAIARTRKRQPSIKKKPPAQGSAAAVTPPRKCDPFANPHGCK
jgi:serine/threonine-protein kinase